MAVHATEPFVRSRRVIPLLKFVFRSTLDRKGRSLLIVLTIAFASGLFYAATAISRVVVDLYLERVRARVGGADLQVESTPRSPTPFFRPDRARGLGSRAAGVIGFLQTTAVYRPRDRTREIELVGARLEDLLATSPVHLEETGDLEPFRGRKIVVPRSFAAEADLAVGDRLALQVGHESYRFRVAAIAADSGAFTDSGDRTQAIVPLDSLGAIHHLRGRVSRLLVDARTPEDVPGLAERLEEIFPRYRVRELLPPEEVAAIGREMSMPFRIMLSFVLVMSAFFVFSSFRVIAAERLPVIGRLRAIGASWQATAAILLAESLAYGAAGGLLGSACGVGMLRLLLRLARPEDVDRGPARIDLHPREMGISFAIALGLSVSGAALPLVQAARASIRDVFLDRISDLGRPGLLRLLVGVPVLAISVAVRPHVPAAHAFGVNLGLMIASLAALVLLAPHATRLVGLVLRVPYRAVLGPDGVLSLWQFRSSRVGSNNVALLTLGLSVLVMIETVSHSVEGQALNRFRDARFDVRLWTWNCDRRAVARVRSVPGVDDALGLVTAWRVDVPSHGTQLERITGVPPGKRYLDFWSHPFSDDPERLFADLERGRTMLVNAAFRERLGLREGDVVAIESMRGRREYQVIGFFDPAMNEGGQALVAERFLRADMKRFQYDQVLVRTTEDPFEVGERIRRKFAPRPVGLDTLAERVQRDRRENARVFLILRGFCAMILGIAAVGVFNNSVVSFLARRRALAVMRSVGMTPFQAMKAILGEGLACGLAGGGLAILAGAILVTGIPHLLKGTDSDLVVSFSGAVFLRVLGLAVVLSLAAAANVAWRSLRFDLVRAIRHE